MVTTTTQKMLLWTLENSGDVIPLDNVVAKDYLKTVGRSGFGVAPTKLITRDGASGGTRWRRTRRGARVIVLPITILGDDRQIVEDKLRRLVRLLQDDTTTPRLVAQYPSSEKLYTSFHYSSGADPVYGSDTDGRTYCKWTLNLLCESPYWTSDKAVSYSIGPANAGHGLLPLLSRLQLSSSQTIGTVLVENPGDVDAFPIWTIRGPGDANFTATRNDGAQFVFEAPLTAEDVITIDTMKKTVTDQNGNNRYADLGSSPKLFALPKGDSQVGVVMTGTESTTLISMYFNPRQELIF
jgi:phage-related protein